MSRCLLCVHVWLENACDRGVAVRLGSWSGVTMARTPFLVPVPCIACYRDQGTISCVDWAIVDRSWCLKRLAQVGGGALFPRGWGVSWVVWQAVSPTCILWFEWNHVVWGCKDYDRISYVFPQGHVGADTSYADRRAIRASVSQNTDSVRKPGGPRRS